MSVPSQMSPSHPEFLTYFGERRDEDPQSDDERQLHALELDVEHLYGAAGGPRFSDVYGAKTATNIMEINIKGQ